MSEVKEAPKRQYVKFTFLQLDASWRLLPEAERKAAASVLSELLASARDYMMLETYSLIGTRGDTDLLIWTAASDLESFNRFLISLRKTVMGAYLKESYSFLSMTKRSMYVDRHTHPDQEGRRLSVSPGGYKFLFVYPFVKLRSWYKLTKSARQGMMDEHIEIGHRYPSVRLHTTYSFGLDDQEFVVAFETNEPGDFLDLVMELRESEASSYTERDTPIFSCISLDIAEAIASLT